MRTTLVACLVCLFVACGASGQDLEPEEAVRRMTLPVGLEAKLFASEPDVRQPILVKCDDRGRLWTIQYLQYPNPAGLKRVKVDRWSRTVYDRVPEPPPHGPRGADRITILTDADGDGRAEEAKDFVDGLNLTTGLAFGHGGVFVINVPYLLFYPDHDRDDVPDSDPEVLLTGFGMEDAQSMANHLTWGPDGWLYGVNGSTTTCNIRGIEFQQGCWRYHPLTREFELFCEGGSNCYGLTFDAQGNLYYSTNGGPFVHAVQGGYFYKSFGKHGPLHNPYAYHYFDQLEVDQVPGGPPTGGTIYLAPQFPDNLYGKFIAGNFLGHTSSWWNIEPAGSTVRATYGGVLLDSHDPWCGPTDMCAGPDGAMYVSDFYDQRTAHPDPDAQWDLTNGRIYKIQAVDAEPAPPLDVVALSSDELVDALSHPNHWIVDRARCDLARRRDESVIPRLRAMALAEDDRQLALESLWALHVSGGLNDETALELLDHPYEYVRSWTVRLLGDRKQVSPAVRDKLWSLAESDPSVVVRSQLAATARRLPGEDGLPIVQRMLARNVDADDPRVPWLLWWAIEAKAMTDIDALVAWFGDPAVWNAPAERDNAGRLIRRYAAEGAVDAYAAAASLVAAAPDGERRFALEQLNQGLSERARGLPGIEQGGLFEQHASIDVDDEPIDAKRYEPIDGPLLQLIARSWSEAPDDPLYLELALHAEMATAYDHLTAIIESESSTADQRVALFGLLRQFGRDDAGALALSVFSTTTADAEKLAALDVVGRYPPSTVAQTLLTDYAQMTPAVQHRTRDLLLSRPDSAAAFLAEVDQGAVAAADVPIDQLRQIALHNDPRLDELVRKHWGNVGPGTSEERLATMRRYNNDLRAAAGDPAHGKALFVKHCGVCHQLHGEGNKVGPDLTSANRQDRAALLANIVDPSAVIRREYMNYVVETTGGQIFTGLLAEQDGGSVTILDAKNERRKIPRSEIETIAEAPTSLMPERILDPLTPEELRDLFSYLERP